MSLENAGEDFIRYVGSEPSFPFLSVIRNYHQANRKDKVSWEEFLFRVGFSFDDFNVYMSLFERKRNLNQNEHNELKKLYQKIIGLFKQKKNNTIIVIEETPEFQIFSKKVQHLCTPEKLSAVVCEYIYASIMTLFMNYEINRISQKIFYIQEENQ